MKRLKNIIIPLSIGSMFLLNTTNVFASYTYDVDKTISNVNYTKVDTSKPTGKSTKIYYENKTDKEAKVEVLHNDKVVSTLNVSPNKSNSKIYDYEPNGKYTYSITVEGGNTKPKGKLIIGDEIEEPKQINFTPRYQYGKIWFQNHSSKEARVTILKNKTEVTSFMIPANSSNHTYYTFIPGESYAYSITSVDENVVPVGKIVIKTGETRNEVQ